MEKDNKASDAYKDYKKGMKYKDIADKYNVSLNTVKSWKRRQWADIEKGVQPKKKSVHTKRTHKVDSNAPPKTKLLPEEIETLNNEELTEKQRLFCLYYVRWFNATKAYQRAYKCDYFTALTAGPRLLGNVRIKEEIQRIKDAKIKQAMYTAEDFFQKMMDIAYSDATDFLSFGRRKDKKTGLECNYVDFLDSSEVDGTLIQEVKQGKDGCSIKLVGKEFALKWLDKHYSEATDLQKAQLEQLRAQTDKLKADNDTSTNETAQDAMDAITGIVEQMKPLGDDET